MKALLKKHDYYKYNNLGYEEEISNFLSDDFKFTKRNTIEFFKRLYKKDSSVRYDKLTIKVKNLKIAEGMFYVKYNNYSLNKFIFINKEMFDSFSNDDYAKAYILTSFIHEMQHKKQFDSFTINKICDIKEKSEIDKFLFYETTISTINPYFNVLNPAPIRELLARAETLNTYVNMIKKGAIKPTKEILLALLPSSLQAYSMKYSVYDNNILFKYKNDANLDFNYFCEYYERKYNDFYNNIDLALMPENKREEIKNINFDKFHYELKALAKKYDDNMCYINNLLLSNYKMPIKYKEKITNMQFISKQYMQKYLKQESEYIVI